MQKSWLCFESLHGYTMTHQFIIALQDRYRLLAKRVINEVFLWLSMLQVGMLFVLLHNFKVSVLKVSCHRALVYCIHGTL